MIPIVYRDVYQDVDSYSVPRHLSYLCVLDCLTVLAYFSYLACLSVLAYLCVLAYFGYLACLRYLAYLCVLGCLSVLAYFSYLAYLGTLCRKLLAVYHKVPSLGHCFL